jgi:hypothetical protein
LPFLFCDCTTLGIVEGLVTTNGRIESTKALPATNSVVQSRYGCFWLRGERIYARKNELADTPASVRSWTTVFDVRFAKALEALAADGRSRRAGRVTLLREYERPCGEES